MPSEARAVVVGGGIAGLSAALELQHLGHSPLLLEAAQRPGGKLATVLERGFLLESAAVGLLDRRGDLAPLCRRLGLDPVSAQASARERWVVREGSLHSVPGSPRAALRSSLLNTREKIGLFGEPLRPRRAAAPPESVRAFFERRLGIAGPFLADLVQTGVYAGDPDRLEARSCFPALTALEEAHGSLLRGALREGRRRPRPRLTSFSGGMGALVEAMTRALEPAVHCGARLRAVREAEGGFSLEVEGPARPLIVHCRTLVLALPAPDAAAALASLDPALADRLFALQAAPLSVVHVGIRSADLSRPQRGFGILAPGRKVCGVVFPSALWSGRAPPGAALFTALVGGARNPAAAALPNADLLQLVREDLAAFAGVPIGATSLIERIVRWPQAIPQYELGHAARMAEIDRLSSLHPGLCLAGSFLHGVSVLDCLRDGRRAALAAAAALNA